MNNSATIFSYNECCIAFLCFILMKMHISRNAAASINKAPAPPEVSIIASWLTVGVGVVVTEVDSVKLVMFGTIPT